MPHPLGRERLGISHVGNLLAGSVVDRFQHVGALRREAVDVAATAPPPRPPRDGCTPNEEALVVEQGQAALAGPQADGLVDHLMNLGGVHEAVRAQQAQDLGLAGGPRHRDDERGITIRGPRRDKGSFVGTCRSYLGSATWGMSLQRGDGMGRRDGRAHDVDDDGRGASSIGPMPPTGPCRSPPSDPSDASQGTRFLVSLVERRRWPQTPGTLSSPFARCKAIMSGARLRRNPGFSRFPTESGW